MQDATLPGVGSVFERMTDELRIEAVADGSGEELVLGLVFSRLRTPPNRCAGTCRSPTPPNRCAGTCRS